MPSRSACRQANRFGPSRRPTSWRPSWRRSTRQTFYGSRDFGDVVALIDGREELTAEVANAPAALREYVAGQLNELSRHPVFDNGLEGAPRGWPRAPLAAGAQPVVLVRQ